MGMNGPAGTSLSKNTQCTCTPFTVPATVVHHLQYQLRYPCCSAPDEDPTLDMTACATTHPRASGGQVSRCQHGGAHGRPQCLVLSTRVGTTKASNDFINSMVHFRSTPSQPRCFLLRRLDSFLQRRAILKLVVSF